MGIQRLAVVVDPEQPLHYRYEAIIDFMLSNPHMKQGEIAAHIGCTQPWLSQIINSDAFQARYAKRRHALNQEQERQISAKIYDMANKASDRVIQELDRGEECDAGFALDAATRALRSIGFGAPVGRPPNVAVQEAQTEAAEGVGAETLRLAREAIQKQSIVMTRITERVEVSSDSGDQVGGAVEDGPVVREAQTFEG